MATGTLLQTAGEGQAAAALEALAYALPKAKVDEKTQAERIGFVIGYMMAGTLLATRNQRRWRTIARAMGTLLASTAATPTVVPDTSAKSRRRRP